MTATHRGISRALIVLALSGTGTGIVGAVSISAHADGLPNPTPLPTTDPTTLLPGGVTDPLPLPAPSDSPSPQPTDTSSTGSGTTTSSGGSTASPGTDAGTSQTGAGQTTAGQATSGATTNKAAATTKSAAQHSATSTGATKGVSVAAAKVSKPAGLDLAKTTGALAQAASPAALPGVGVAAGMTPLMHGLLSLPNLPALPGVTGSSPGADGTARAPIVAPLAAAGGAVATTSGGVSAQAYAPASSATPTSGRSPVAPALFALIAAAVAAGVAKVRIRWGQR